MMKTICAVAVASFLVGSGGMADEGVDLLAWRAAYQDRVANEYTDYGADLERVGAYKKAAKVYHLAAKRSGDDAVAGYAMLCRADAMYAARRHFRALDYYKEAVGKYPQHIDYGHAIDMFRVIAEDFANGRMRGLFKGFHKRDARELYRYFIGLAPYGERSGRDMLRLAELERQAREVNEAVGTYQSIMQRFPDDEVAAIARIELANTLVNEAINTRDSYRLAEAAGIHVERALAVNPEQPEALAIRDALNRFYAGYYHYLGEFYSRPAHYRPEAALRYYETVFKGYPASGEAQSAALRWASLSGSEVPEVPNTPENIGKTRELPRPESVVPGLKFGEEPAPEPGRQIEPKKGVEKWLLPIDDQGL